MNPALELYRRVWEYVWSKTTAPTPAELARWIRSQRWTVQRTPEGRDWLDTILGRLDAWPAGRNYPIVPDDEAMAGLWDDEAKWWEPGAVRGDIAILQR